MMILGEININPLLKAKEKFDNFSQHLSTEQEKAGAIQAFEFSYELSWKILKKILRKKGTEVASPRDTFREAAKNKLINNLEKWFAFLEGRNLTTHTYDENYVDAVIKLFPDFKQALAELIEHIKWLK